MSGGRGDELLPALYGEGPLPDHPDPRWSPAVRALYDALVRVSAQASAPYQDETVLAGTDPTLHRDVAEVLSGLRTRRALLTVISDASTQLSTGRYDLGRLVGEAVPSVPGVPLVPLAEKLKNGPIKPPIGVHVPYPSIQQATGGIIGMWVLGGETGVGKSTFAFTLALNASQHGMNVLYYDAENGEEVLLYRLLAAYGSQEKVESAVERIYVRSSMSTIDADLRYIPAPALVIVDSAQKFGYEFRSRSYRESINALIRKLEIIKRSGYGVVLVSEIARASYGQVSNAGYAETRELEFSADVAAQVVLQDDYVEFHITKNRHKPRRGLVSVLRRTHGWLFEELPTNRWDEGGQDD